MLFRLGQVADSLLIWEAKRVSFDSWATISLALIFGAGYDETWAYLQRSDARHVPELLTKLREYGDLVEYRDLAQLEEVVQRQVKFFHVMCSGSDDIDLDEFSDLDDFQFNLPI
jgi:hypothetical protein